MFPWLFLIHEFKNESDDFFGTVLCIFNESITVNSSWFDIGLYCVQNLHLWLIFNTSSSWLLLLKLSEILFLQSVAWQMRQMRCKNMFSIFSNLHLVLMTSLISKLKHQWVQKLLLLTMLCINCSCLIKWLSYSAFVCFFYMIVVT